MKVLFLDDDEQRHTMFEFKHRGQLDITHVRNYDEFIDAVQSGERYEMYFLDHDLSDEDAMVEPGASSKEKTGTDVAEWIASNVDAKNGPGIVVHSLNPPGAERMALNLRNAGFDVVKQPFYQMIYNIRYA